MADPRREFVTAAECETLCRELIEAKTRGEVFRSLNTLLPDLASMVAEQLRHPPPVDVWTDVEFDDVDGERDDRSEDLSLDIDIAEVSPDSLAALAIASPPSPSTGFDSIWVDVSVDLASTGAAWAALDRNAFVEALALFGPGDRRADVRAGMSFARFMLTDDETQRSEEIDIVQQIAALDPTCLRTQVYAARMNLKVHRREKARALLERAVGIEPDAVDLVAVRETAQRLLERMSENVAPQPEKRSYVPLYGALAVALALALAFAIF